MLKKINFMFLILGVFLSFIPIVLADDNNLIDLSRKGEITITLQGATHETPLEGIEIKLYQIATLDIENNNIKFNYLDGFSSCTVDLNNLNKKNIASDLENCRQENETTSFSKKTNYEGKVKFTNLSLGLYLAMQVNQIEGYSTFDSFLIMIPENIDNKYNYNVDATPKTDIFKTMELKVQKMWFNMYYPIPEKITVALMKDDEIIQTAELGNHNNWTYTFKDIPKYDSYKVIELDVPEGFKVVYREYSNVYMIINIDYLAQTGQNVILIVMLSCIGIMLIIIGLICQKRKKYE